MEEQLHEINSDSLRKPHIKNILYELDYAIDQAADKRDEQLAENPELRRALAIVETFLRRKNVSTIVSARRNSVFSASFSSRLSAAWSIA